MLTKEIDARGLPCPQPVIMARSAMKEADEVTILVTGDDQVDNVRRLAEKAGWQVAIAPREGAKELRLSKGAAPQEPVVTPDMTICALPGEKGPGAVVVVSGDAMGRGEAELGGILVRSFFHVLTEVEPLPQAIVFYSSGVKLVVEGSPILNDLQALAAKGVELLACGTCLGYYNLKEHVRVGAISNMYTIAEVQLNAHHVVTL